MLKKLFIAIIVYYITNVNIYLIGQDFILTTKQFIQPIKAEESFSQ
ncbi:hypothetical protein NHE_0552 [Neorickettsia helminthoeca str. Oregon]|uniref:Uncharacterized protein n=1 Tax=Neorickettsia helminthoeca str. Oregon TaxID=1286528 RepID=X5H4L3_9RICK|nr:hypothetical protein NHE_0552 [Neorickettsia helminthoeca str. Oregon]